MGFTLDSLIEIGASTVAIWQLTEVSQWREKNALRSIGTAFFVLATYILTHSLETLLASARPHQSPIPIEWANYWTYAIGSMLGAVFAARLYEAIWGSEKHAQGATGDLYQALHNIEVKG